MNTSWGEIAVSDAHVHFFSHGFLSLIKGQKEELAARPVEQIAAQLGWKAPPPDPEDLGRIWVEELDRHHVERAALIASLPGDEPSVAAAIRRYPDRFFGYFMLNGAAPDAIERVESAAQAGFRCACLFPAMHRYSLADARLDPVFAAIGRAGLRVFVHCGVLTVGIRKKLGLPSPFDLRLSNPVDVPGVALRYPHVRFVIPHLGAGFLREALMAADLCPNLYLDTSSSNSWVRYLPGQPDLEAVFRQTLEVVGAGRLLFGTDSSFFPRGWNRSIFEAQQEVLWSLGVSKADATRIFGGNLLEFLS